MPDTRKTARGRDYEPREYKVYTPAGLYYARDPNLQSCIAAANKLGTGAYIEGLDQDLNPTGDIIYTVK
jgi:hypothetical protein